VCRVLASASFQCARRRENRRCQIHSGLHQNFTNFNKIGYPAPGRLNLNAIMGFIMLEKGIFLET
jgi:hypothetical protein